MDEIHTLMNSSMARLFVLEKDSGMLATRGEDEADHVTVDASHGILGRTITLRSPQVLNKIGRKQTKLLCTDAFPGTKIESTLCVPCIVDGVVLGVIQAVNKHKARAGGKERGDEVEDEDDEDDEEEEEEEEDNYGSEDIELLTSIADHVSAALLHCLEHHGNRSKLQEAMHQLHVLEKDLAQAQETERSLNSSHLHKDFMLNLAKTLSGHLEMNSLFETVIAEAREMLDADRGTLFLIDREKKVLWSRVANGIDDLQIPLDSGIAGHVATTGDVVNIKDAHLDHRFNHSVDLRSGYRTRSMLCCAVKADDETVLGVVQCMNKRTGHFTEADEALLEDFANHISGPIMITSMNEETKQEAERARGQLKEVEVEMHELRDALTTEKLRSKEQLDSARAKIEEHAEEARRGEASARGESEEGRAVKLTETTWSHKQSSRPPSRRRGSARKSSSSLRGTRRASGYRGSTTARFRNSKNTRSRCERSMPMRWLAPAATLSNLRRRHSTSLIPKTR